MTRYSINSNKTSILENKDLASVMAKLKISEDVLTSEKSVRAYSYIGQSGHGVNQRAPWVCRILQALPPKTNNNTESQSKQMTVK